MVTPSIRPGIVFLIPPVGDRLEQIREALADRELDSYILYYGSAADERRAIPSALEIIRAWSNVAAIVHPSHGEGFNDIWFRDVAEGISGNVKQLLSRIAEDGISIIPADMDWGGPFEDRVVIYGDAQSIAGEISSKLPEPLIILDVRRVERFATVFIPDIEFEIFKFFQKYPEKLYSISPRKFEEFVASLFKHHGFEVSLTPATRDGGFDILAVHHSELTDDMVSLVECKRYAPDRPVGIGVVQRLLGTVEQVRANKGVLVTTSFFTSPALKAAELTRHKIALKDYLSIVDWLKSLTV